MLVVVKVIMRISLFISKIFCIFFMYMCMYVTGRIRRGGKFTNIYTYIFVCMYLCLPVDMCKKKKKTEGGK